LDCPIAGGRRRAVYQARARMPRHKYQTGTGAKSDHSPQRTTGWTAFSIKENATSPNLRGNTCSDFALTTSRHGERVLPKGYGAQPHRNRSTADSGWHIPFARHTAGGDCKEAGSSSDTTSNLRSVELPNDVRNATSAASRPVAIRIRPMRGVLLRASKAHHL